MKKSFFIIVVLIIQSVFGQSIVIVDSLYSPSLGKTMPISIVVPSSYDGQQPIPILYLLHGYGIKHDYFIQNTDIEQYIEDSNVLCVMPDAGNSWWINAYSVSEDRYEDYLINDITKYIENKYNIDTNEQYIAGFSMGGYGAVTLALRNPGRFDYVASISGAIQIPKDIEKLEKQPGYRTIVPSLDRAFGEAPNTFRDTYNPFNIYKNTQTIDLPYIFLFFGLQEGNNLMSANQDFADSLNVYGAYFEVHELPGTHNAATCDASLNILLNRIKYFKEKAYKSFAPALMQVILKHGVNNAIEKYHEIKLNKKIGFKFNEWELNNLGYMLLGKDMIIEAIEIFKLNVEEYPDASNPYDSLGEAYMIEGQKELAIKNYEKSLELNPNNTSAVKILEELKQ